MSLPHFFLEKQVLSAECDTVFPLHLSADDAKHLKVLRLSSGEHIAVIDAVQDYFECEIVSEGEKGLLIRIAKRFDNELDYPRILLVQGLAKADKMEMVIRHATELGVTQFLPLACARSVMKIDKSKVASKMQRWQTIAKSAAMQSGQKRLPEVLAPTTLAELCITLAQCAAVLVCWEEAPRSASLHEAAGHLHLSSLPAGARVALVIGPEGGFENTEVEALLAANERSSLVSLGSSILRTETAGIVAPALLLYELGFL